MNAVQALARLRFFLREPNAARFADADLLDLLNEGFLSAARQSFCLEREVLLPATNKIAVYPLVKILPDFLAAKRVAWRDFVIDNFDDLDRAALSSYAYQAPTSTEVTRWSFQDGNLILHPPPTVTTYAGATVTVTRDSTTVAVTAGNPVTGGVGVGWLFGVGASPTKWYAVKEVAAASIELQTPYREETAAGSASLQTSGAIRLLYAALPAKLRLFADPGATIHHYYSQGTVAFTLDSETVPEVAATSWGLVHGAGQEIGVGTMAAKPRLWVKVRQRVSATSLRLWNPWPIESTGTVNYLLTDQSPFAPNEERSLVAVYHAAAAAWAGVEEGEKMARQYQVMYEQELVRVKQDVGKEETRETQGVVRIAKPYHPFFGGRVIPRGN